MNDGILVRGAKLIEHSNYGIDDNKPFDEVRDTNVPLDEVDFSIIRFLRLCMGMNQSEFSKRLGISQVYCHELESGKSIHPSDKLIARISKLCGIRGSTVRFFLEDRSGRSKECRERMISILQEIAEGIS